MKPANRMFIGVAAGTVLGFVSALTSGVLADRTDEQETVIVELPVEEAKLLAEVLHRVRSDYVDPVEYDALIESAIRLMVSDLDPNSEFLDPDQYEEMRISTTGSYSGVGIEVSIQGEQVVVVAPFDGTPAQRAGIRSGDVIISIDGMPVRHDNLGETITKMRGDAGSLVNIVVTRKGHDAPISYELERTHIQVASVRAKLIEPEYGYLRITQFSESTGAEVATAVSQLLAQSDGDLDGLFLDLRNNPGGVLDAAVDVADIFLDDGLIVSAYGRTEEARFSMRAHSGDLLGGARLMVLVNEGSASSSEIVAGALKDLDRATIVGTTTYGKGSVQTVIPLSGGRALKLTTSRYFTPSGESIHQRGIIPDIIVASDDDDPALLLSVGGNLSLDAIAADSQLQTALSTAKDKTILHSKAE